MRIPTILTTALLVGACARPSEPYDEDLAYCRRAAASPITTTTASPLRFHAGSTSSIDDPDLVAGFGDQRFRACMRSRFQQRFPGVPYPLDPP